ncbi:MAG: metallophosphoesterase [Clostridia bacterium]|nr:metallophosphoesterase [Clostridia bacterium]
MEMKGESIMQMFFRKATVFILSFCMFLGPWIGKTFCGEDAFFETWDASQPYTETYAVSLEKPADRDFIVLNLADIQMTNDEALGEMGEAVRENTDRMVKELKPDLITLSGDNAWGDYAYVKLIRMIDSYGIPWAPVMGNHDGQGCPSEFWCAYNLSKAKNCLFRFGPADMGYGNYIINITSGGDILHTLFMMDTHSYIEEDGSNGPASEDNYDHLWTNQFDWYRWGVEGIRQLAGHPVESTVIMHIPVYEYKTAWEEATGISEWTYSAGSAPFIGEYADTSFGVRHEYGGWSPQSNGFFDLMKTLGSTKNVIVGHDHVSDYSIVYQGIRLTYAVKDGPGCYWEPAMNGCTTLSVNDAGQGSVAHHFYEYPEA